MLLMDVPLFSLHKSDARRLGALAGGAMTGQMFDHDQARIFLTPKTVFFNGRKAHSHVEGTCAVVRFIASRRTKRLDFEVRNRTLPQDSLRMIHKSAA